MSWARDDVEGYDGVCLNGVTDKVCETVAEVSGDRMNVESMETVRCAMEAIQQTFPKVWSELMDVSVREISDAEAAHFTRGI